MAPDLSNEAWAQIRHDYEHTELTVEDICVERGISSGTLRDRMRRWNWTRRRPPIPREGPPPVPAPAIEPTAPDDSTIVPRLQSAVARVLPAIEAILLKLGSGSTPPREMERAARTLTTLTRTLRELNGLLGQHQAAAADDPADDDPVPKDMDAFRRELARRMDAFLVARTGKAAGDA